MKIVPVLVVLLMIIPVTAHAARMTLDSTPSTAPPGYYFDPATSTWYYYDGTTLTAQPPGFVPPLDEQIKFELRVYAGDPNQSGWALHIEGKFLGSQTVTYRVESNFTRDGSPFCPMGSETTTPPCVVTDSVTTQSYPLGIGPVVLGIINRTEALSSFKPNSGDASAWGWQDSEATPRYHAGVLFWS